MAFFSGSFKLRKRVVQLATLSISVCLLIISLVVSVFLSTRNQMIALLSHKARDMAQVIALLLETDAGRYQTLTADVSKPPEGADLAFYLQTQQMLRRIALESGFDFIYTEVMVSEHVSAHVLDSADPDSEDFLPFGHLQPLSEHKASVYRHDQPAVSPLSLLEPRGWFMSGHAPIHHPETGRILGIATAKISLCSLRQLLQVLSLSFLLFALIMLATALLIVSRLLQTRFRSIDYDCQTDLHSHSFFDQMLRQIMAARPDNSKSAVLFIAIDQHELISDQYGLPAGDRVLRDVAAIIRAHARQNDVAARYGGDEFALLIPDSDQARAMSLAECIRQALCAFNQERAAIAVTLTLSIGIAVGGKSRQAFLAAAKAAMQRAKANGGDRIELADEAEWLAAADLTAAGGAR